MDGEEAPMFHRNPNALNRSLLVLTAAVLILAGCLSFSFGEDAKPDLFKQLKYRYIGPVGNRVSAVVGVPGNPAVCFAGAASGGIFKSIDGGVNWTPVFDGQDVQSIGSLAIAPSDSNIVWAGTGEAFIRSNVSQGNGIYKSTDGGKTWARMGLEQSGRIARIVIDPRNP